MVPILGGGTAFFVVLLPAVLFRPSATLIDEGSRPAHLAWTGRAVLPTGTDAWTPWRAAGRIGPGITAGDTGP